MIAYYKLENTMLKVMDNCFATLTLTDFDVHRGTVELCEVTHDILFIMEDGQPMIETSVFQIIDEHQWKEEFKLYQERQKELYPLT